MRPRLYLLAAVIAVVALLAGVSAGGASNDRDDGRLRSAVENTDGHPGGH
jgi:hypothetical protein